MWVPLVMQDVSKRALQWYSKCNCVASVTKTFTHGSVQTVRRSTRGVHYLTLVSKWTVCYGKMPFTIQFYRTQPDCSSMISTLPVHSTCSLLLFLEFCLQFSVRSKSCLYYGWKGTGWVQTNVRCWVEYLHLRSTKNQGAEIICVGNSEMCSGLRYENLNSTDH
jgi:hypothetical protein